MTSYILCLVVLTFTLPVKALETQNFTNKPIELPVGLHYESMHQIRFTKAEWKLVTYVDMKKFENQRPVLSEDMFKPYEDFCFNSKYINTNICHSLTDKGYLMTHMSLIDKYLKHIHAIMDVKKNRTLDKNSFTIKRSAPLGFIGSVSKALFGTMNEDDAEYYNKQIDRLFDDQNHIVNLMMNQTDVVQSEFQRLHIEIDDIKNVTNKAMDLISEAMEHTQKLENMTTAMAVVQRMQEWVRNKELEIDTYMSSLLIIIDSIYFAKLGFIHPGLITPEVLENAVDHFLKHGNRKEYSFPLSLDEVRAGELSKISRTEIGYHEGKLLMMLHVPLLDNSVYHLYKMHPYPTPQIFGENKKASAYIQPTTDYLIISEDQTKYTLIHESDLPRCQVTHSFHICTPNYPIYEASMRPACEMELIKQRKENPLEICDIRVSKNFNPYWKQLHNMRGWLYSLSEEEKIDILCTADWKETITLSGAGILYLRPGCKAHTVYASLTGYQVISEPTTYEFKPIIKLNVTDLLPQVINYDPLHSTPRKADIPRIKSSPNIPGVLSYDVTLTEIRKDLEELGKHKREKQKERTWFYWLGFSQLSLLVMFIIFLIRARFLWLFYKGVDRIRSLKVRNSKNHENEEVHTSEARHDEPIYAVPSNRVF